MILYHGTTLENAESIIITKNNSKGIWCSNDTGIAKSYGNTLVAINIPELSFGVECYPLSTGKLTELDYWGGEPIEFFIRPDIDISSCWIVE